LTKRRQEEEKEYEMFRKETAKMRNPREENYHYLITSLSKITTNDKNLPKIGKLYLKCGKRFKMAEDI
jgi:hypothetical protein